MLQAAKERYNLAVIGEVKLTSPDAEGRPAPAEMRNSEALKDARSVNEADEFRPLTREEALTLRQRSPRLSLWRVVALQAFVACVVAGLAWWVTGRLSGMWSAGYGGLAVVLPAALFARALSRQAGLEGGNTVLASFFLWELAKIGLTLAMLLLAPRLVTDLSWPALVAGFVVTMKVYGLSMWLRLASASKVKKT